MSLSNTFTLNVDFKKSTYLNEPIVTSNDEITFILNVFDDEQPFDLSNVTTVTLTSVRPDKQSVLTNGTKTGNQVTFNLGNTEVAVAGRVNAQVQMYDASGRVSTLPFTYKVLKDPVQDYVPSVDEQTLIELVLGEGPVILANAEQAITDLNNLNTTVTANEEARQSSELNRETSETMRVLNESDRQDAEDTRKSNESARESAELTRTTDESIRQLNETDRQNAETNRTNTFNTQMGLLDDALPNVQNLENVQTWSGATQYYKNNIVEYNGSSFMAIADSLGQTPPTLPTKSNEYWSLIAQRGVDGKGAVASVNGILPDVNGNVELTELKEVNRMTTTLQHGLSVINNDHPSPLKVEFYGDTKINLLGKASDLTLVSEQVKDFYFKPTSSSVLLIFTLGLSEGTVHYSIRKKSDNSYVVNTMITSTSGFKYVKTSGLVIGEEYYFRIYNASKSTKTFSRYAVYPISQSNYDKIGVSLTDEDVERMFPYVDSVQHVKNPVITVEGENLFSDFYSKNFVLISLTESDVNIISPYEIQVKNPSGDRFVRFEFDVVSNTTYTFKADEILTDFAIFDATNGSDDTIISPYSTTKERTFNTGKSRKIRIYFRSRGKDGSIKNPMLNLGSTAKPFTPKNDSYLYAETTLAGLPNSDKKDILFQDFSDSGKWKKLKNFEVDKAIFEVVNWNSSVSHTGYKRLIGSISGLGTISKNDIIVKFNGSFLRHEEGVIIIGGANADAFGTGNSITIGRIDITVSNADSGWLESQTITTDLIKSYFYGWKYTGDGTTHSWVSLVDGSAPTTNSLAYVSTTMAPNFTPYKLTYQLASPTIEEVTVEGDLSIQGDAQVEVTSGFTYTTDSEGKRTYTLTPENERYKETSNLTEVKVTYATNIASVVSDLVPKVSDNTSKLSTHDFALDYIEAQAMNNALDLDNHELLDASTTQKGHVQLNNTLTSTSTTEALTANQGKVLDDKITVLTQDVGDKTTLNTTNKTSVVAGINEINSNIDKIEKKVMVSVTDFGAVGDGIADDTQAIKDAIEYASSINGTNHRTVYFPCGKYKITSSITINVNFITLKGEGQKQSVIEGINLSSDMIVVNSDYGVKLEELFLLNSTTTPSRTVVLLKGEGHIVESCYLKNNTGNNVEMLYYQGANTKIRNCGFDNFEPNSYCILVFANTAQININTDIVGNYFGGTGKGLIIGTSDVTRRPEGIKIHENTFLLTGSEQITIKSAYYVDISHNIIDVATVYNIWIDSELAGVDGINISDNYFGNAAEYGQCVNIENTEVGVVNITISNNYFGTCGYAISGAANLEGIIIKGNYFKDVKQTSISLAESKKVIITGNIEVTTSFSLDISDGTSGGSFIIANNIFVGSMMLTKTDVNKFKILNNVGLE